MILYGFMKKLNYKLAYKVYQNIKNHDITLN